MAQSGNPFLVAGEDQLLINDVVLVTPADGTALVYPSGANALPCRALLLNVTVAGNVVITTANGTQVTLTMPVGLWGPGNMGWIRAATVRATGLTMTATIWALY